MNDPSHGTSETIAWEPIASRVGSYAFAECAEGSDDAVYCGLRLRTSAIRAHVAAHRGGPAARVPFLFVFADTLEVDDPLLPTGNATVVARRLVQGSGPTAIAVAPPDETDIGVASVQILTQGIAARGLAIACGDAAAWTPDGLTEGPTVVHLVRTTDGSADDAGCSTTATSVHGMVRHPMAWNALKAGFEAAALLIDGSEASVAEGLNVLQWVCACTRLIASEPGPFQPEAADLAHQSQALLVLLGGRASAPYVPVLSADFYAQRIAGLLEVVQAYEQKSEALATRQDIEHAVDDVSQALAQIGRAEGAAIEVAIRNNQSEASALRRQYQTLLNLYTQQQQDIRLKQILFQHALEEKRVWDTVKAVVAAVQAVAEMAGAVGAMAVAPAAAPEAAAGAAKGAAAAAKGAEAATQAAEAAKTVSAAWSQLAAGVKALKQLQDKIGKVIKAGNAVYAAAQGMKSAVTEATDTGSDLTAPDWAEMATTDPAMEWKLFGDKVEGALKSSVDDGVSGASDYLNSLKILIEYGKTLNTKAVALAVLQGHSLELKAQADAAHFAHERWGRLSAEAATVLQKQAALQALLRQHLINCKRTLFVNVRAYSAAHFYRYLVEPDVRVGVAMDHAQCQDACERVQTGIGDLLSSTIDQDFDTGYFDLPVVRAGAEGPSTPSPSRALLAVADGQAQLSFVIPIRQPPCVGHLPQRGYMGLFIKQGWFYLVGARPNASGAVGLTVSTSGACSNGYGGQGVPLHFVSRPFSVQFNYSSPQPDDVFTFDAYGVPFDRKGRPIHVNTHWKPENPQFYLNPSPFTEWLVTVDDAGDLEGVTSLCMRLVGVYHSAATPGHADGAA